MRKVFEAELQGVGDDLIAMATAVHTAIERAGQALLNKDHQLAQEVIIDDARIDAMQRFLDERCVHILAQQAPVATDLRTLVAALRMSATLERMGDLASHVAEIARGRYPASAIPDALRPVFERMIEAATDAVKQVTVLLRTRDLALASAIARDDDILDNLRTETYASLLHPEWTGTSQEAVDITLLGRYLERIGDHSTSISRRIVFLVTGEVKDKSSLAAS
jgi:phosphate transport system protein